MKDAQWNCDFADAGVFHDVAFALTPLLQGEYANKRTDWPTLDDYQYYLDQCVNPVKLSGVTRLKVVSQDAKPKSFAETYLARIFLRGEIQTRCQNWHDLFQILSWRLFPNTKAVLVARHFDCARQRWLKMENGTVDRGTRSVEENLLSLWDEGGLLLLSDETEIPCLLRNFQWQELFLAQRHRLPSQLRMLVFGHALFDKLRHPYIGLTANSIILPLSSSLLRLPSEELLPIVDLQLAQLLNSEGANRDDNDTASRASSPFTDRLETPRDLQPFPLLGMPGMWPGNDLAEFYHDIRYFRPGRRHQVSPQSP